MTEELVQQTEEKRVIHRIDVAKALKLRLNGNTCEEIGAIFGVTRQAVSQALTNFEPFINNIRGGDLTAFSEQKANLLNVAQMRLLRSLLDEDAIQKATLNNRAYAFQQLHHATRLEEDKSTGNVSVLGHLILSAEDKLGQPPQQVVGQGSGRKVVDVSPQNHEGSTEQSRVNYSDGKKPKPKKARSSKRKQRG